MLLAGQLLKEATPKTVLSNHAMKKGQRMKGRMKIGT